MILQTVEFSMHVQKLYWNLSTVENLYIPKFPIETPFIESITGNALNRVNAQAVLNKQFQESSCNSIRQNVKLRLSICRVLILVKNDNGCSSLSLLSICTYFTKSGC
jgi:hypothetical protein